MNKTIEINPSLFSLSSKSKREKKEKSLKPKAKPAISPNIMKNKLLKRIKEHKLNENVKHNKSLNPKSVSSVDNSDKFSDDFESSLEYLQNLAKQNQNNNLKNKIERQTVKNHKSIYSSTQNDIQVDLPDDLMKTPLIKIDTAVDMVDDNLFDKSLSLDNTITLNNTLSLDNAVSLDNTLSLDNAVSLDNTAHKTVDNTHNDNSHLNKTPQLLPDVPYGNLKNGIKPTFRAWNKTQKNVTIKSTEPSTIKNTEPETSLNPRQLKLNDMKNKLNEKHMINNTSNSTPIINNISTIDTRSVKQNYPFNRKTIKTIKRKYILGKTKNNRSVSILIKDNKTRKKIIDACKDLNKKTTNEIKDYLRAHNLIKLGSNTPVNILRKMYDSAMMSGEVINTNKETMVDNFL